MAVETATVVDPTLLAERWDDPDLVVIEVHAEKAAPAPTIPGAVAVHWKDLARHPSDRLLASREEFSERLHALGAGEGSRIVLAGAPTQFASYVVWAARVRGFTQLAYLDGGLEAWTALGLPDAATPGQTTPERPAASRPLPLPEHELDQHLIGRDDVRSLLGREDVVILDYRTPEEYSGERVSGPSAPIDHGAERHGRIPGARHLFFRELLDAQGRLLPADALRAVVDQRLGGIEPAVIVNYCRLSHRSTLGWVALSEVLGLDNVRVYDGSWTEWGSIVGFPVER